MNQFHCNIIRDLIPSYLDDICSEESREAVNQHIASCQSCRSHLESLKRMDIVPIHPGNNELDYMKKVKNYYVRKNTLGAAMLFGLSVMILPVIATLHPNQDDTLYCVLFTVLALGTYFLLSNYQTKPQKHWTGILSAAASVFGILYSAVLAGIVYYCLWTDTGILGLPLSKTGPVLNHQLILIVIIQLLAFAVCAAETVRKKYAFSLLPSLNLTCCALSMFFRELLFHMDSRGTILQAILRYAGKFLLMTVCILLAESALKRIRIHADKKLGF